jgi:hypothetical protein
MRYYYYPKFITDSKHINEFQCIPKIEYAFSKLCEKFNIDTSNIIFASTHGSSVYNSGLDGELVPQATYSDIDTTCCADTKITGNQGLWNRSLPIQIGERRWLVEMSGYTKEEFIIEQQSPNHFYLTLKMSRLSVPLYNPGAWKKTVLTAIERQIITGYSRLEDKIAITPSSAMFLVLNQIMFIEPRRWYSISQEFNNKDNKKRERNIRYYSDLVKETLDQMKLENKIEEKGKTKEQEPIFEICSEHNISISKLYTVVNLYLTKLGVIANSWRSNDYNANAKILQKVLQKNVPGFRRILQLSDISSIFGEALQTDTLIN